MVTKVDKEMAQLESYKSPSTKTDEEMEDKPYFAFSYKSLLTKAYEEMKIMPYFAHLQSYKSPLAMTQEEMAPYFVHLESYKFPLTTASEEMEDNLCFAQPHSLQSTPTAVTHNIVTCRLFDKKKRCTSDGCTKACKSLSTEKVELMGVCTEEYGCVCHKLSTS
uniref:Uncharacterized protein n=1 Tax=Homalodisca liturata TaxID=320908 RepID=A0A1B6K480_9HEMI